MLCTGHKVEDVVAWMVTRPVLDLTSGDGGGEKPDPADFTFRSFVIVLAPPAPFLAGNIVETVSSIDDCAPNGSSPKVWEGTTETETDGSDRVSHVAALSKRDNGNGSERCSTLHRVTKKLGSTAGIPDLTTGCI